MKWLRFVYMPSSLILHLSSFLQVASFCRSAGTGGDWLRFVMMGVAAKERKEQKDWVRFVKMAGDVLEAGVF
ncbi:MAG: hypothetical protein ACYC7E_12980 [Armatimonadota bacterium]